METLIIHLPNDTPVELALEIAECQALAHPRVKGAYVRKLQAIQYLAQDRVLRSQQDLMLAYFWALEQHLREACQTLIDQVREGAAYARRVARRDAQHGANTRHQIDSINAQIADMQEAACKIINIDLEYFRADVLLESVRQRVPRKLRRHPGRPGKILQRAADLSMETLDGTLASSEADVRAFSRREVERTMRGRGEGALDERIAAYYARLARGQHLAQGLKKVLIVDGEVPPDFSVLPVGFEQLADEVTDLYPLSVDEQESPRADVSSDGEGLQLRLNYVLEIPPAAAEGLAANAQSELQASILYRLKKQARSARA